MVRAHRCSPHRGIDTGTINVLEELPPVHVGLIGETLEDAESPRTIAVLDPAHAGTPSRSRKSRGIVGLPFHSGLRTFFSYLIDAANAAFCPTAQLLSPSLPTA